MIWGGNLKLKILLYLLLKKKMLPQNLLSKSTHMKLIIFINKKGYIYEC